MIKLKIVFRQALSAVLEIDSQDMILFAIKFVSELSGTSILSSTFDSLPAQGDSSKFPENLSLRWVFNYSALALTATFLE